MVFTRVIWIKHALPILVIFICLQNVQSAILKDVLMKNDAEDDLTRSPRELRYRTGRNTASSQTQTVSSSRPIKPEDSGDTREHDNLERRCARCDYYYYYNRDRDRDRDYRNPYPSDSRGTYDDRNDDRYYKERDRYYDDRYRERDRYYDDRYRDRVVDTYDRRYYDSDRRYYDYDRDRYDRNERRPDIYDRNDRYDKDGIRYYEKEKNDKGDQNRYYDRYDRVGYRPWDETTRGSSGFDNSGRGYYFAVGRPEYSSYGSGYASNWNYSRDDDRDRSWREQGFGSGSYRPRDPYDPGYRDTSYLYGRQSSSTTTESAIPSEGLSDTDQPQPQDNRSSG